MPGVTVAALPVPAAVVQVAAAGVRALRRVQAGAAGAEEAYPPTRLAYWEHARERVQLGPGHVRQELRQLCRHDGIRALQHAPSRIGERDGLAPAVRKRLVTLYPARLDQGS